MLRRIHSILLLFALLVGGAGMSYVQAANVTLTVTASPAAGGQVRIAGGSWTTSTNGTTSRSVAQSTPMSISAQAASGYTFSQWNDGNKNATRAVQITKNTTYTATFIPNTVTLTVTSNNTNYGTVTGGGTYNYGTSVTIKATPKTGYHFVQWSDGNKNASRTVTATANASYTATFAINTYTITFKNEDGSTLKTQTVDYNVKPTPPSNPTKTATAQYTYTFSGWSPTIVAATADATYTAQFSSTVRSYTIRFLNGSSVLQSSSVKYGTTPSYTGSTPTKSSTAQYSYTFSGWSPAIYAVNKAQDYTAQFSSTVRSYKITGASANTAMGTVSGTATKQYNQTVTLTATPKSCYKFVQWNDGNTSNPRTVTVQGTATYTATFEENIYSGTCGATGNEANVQWSLNMCTGTLSITGTGAMKDYGSNSTPWDSYRASIKSITIANGVTHIGSSSFHYCAATSVTIPSSVITIGDFAFFRCASLTSINIPSSVTTINFEAFRGCTSLTSVTIPNSVTGLGMDVFNECTSLTSATLSNSITTIPGGLFEGCSALTSVKIPNGVTSIEGYAFSECSSLPSVTIPNSVTMLGYRVLYKCTSLKDIYVSWTTPDAIPEFPFDMPTGSAIRLHIPCGTKSIYQALSNWKSYTLVEEIAGGTCGTNVTWTLSCDGTLTISGTGAMADWSSASNVPWYSYRSSITSVNIGSGVTSIGNRAFYGCSNLPSVSIPSSVTSIGTYAFQNCTNLTSVSIPSGSEIYFYSSVFGGCSRLKSFVFPRNITHLGLMTFAGCSSLKSVFMPKTITEIQGPAFNAMFSGCTSLKDVYAYWTTNVPTSANLDGIHDRSSTQITLHIPCNTTEAYQTANWNTKFVLKEEIAGGICGATGNEANVTWTLSCDSILTISGTGAMADWSAESAVPWYAYKDAIKNVVINEGVTRIGSYAFKYCNKIVNVSIPSSITSIGIWAFDQCTGVEGLHISDLTAWCTVQFESFASNPLYYAAKPDLYVNDELIVNLVIPEGVTSIYKHAFQHCSAQTITLPEGLQIIGEGNASAFAYTTISSITIPQSVTYLGRWSFTDNDNLTDIYVYWTKNIPAWNNMTNKSPQSNITLHVPCGKTAIYQAASGWKNYTITDDVTLSYSGTCGAAGHESDVTWSLDLCDSILTISGTGAMFNYTNTNNLPWVTYRDAIKTIIVEEGVTSIGSRAFGYSTNATSVSLPSSVTSIGDYAFISCSSLQEIIIPNTIDALGTHMLYACGSLTDIYVSWTSSIPEWPTNFTNKSPQSGITLHVPCSAMELYQAADGWKDYTVEGEGGPYTVTVTTDDASMGDVSIIVN